MKSKGVKIESWIEKPDADSACRWLDSRKAHRKARWLRKFNRSLNRQEKKEWFVPWEEWTPPPFHTESYWTRTFINQDG